MFTTEIESSAEIEISAVRLLSQCEHTVRQLRGKLLKKGFEAKEVDQVLRDLKAQDLVSDERFAREYVAFRILKGFGPVRIAQEMREKGVADFLVDQAMDDYSDQWNALMEKALIKKFGAVPVLNYTERARRARFLEYRGFPASMIRHGLFNQD